MDVVWTPPRARADPNIRIAYMSDARMEDDTGKVLCKRFELRGLIGAGATAAVYRALDRQTKSEVAVKMLYKSRCSDAESLRYFAQEGRLAARIIHPHLLRAHYYGQRYTTPFIVFELVPGMSLTQIAALRPMPWRRLVVIVLQVLDALARLHEENVIHGDIQPENVIVQQTTLGQDFAKVIDLGFASARGCSRLTLAPEPPSEIHGTAGFIAPERLAGLEPDARADLYSVGAMMYFLLTTRLVPDISLAPDELGVPTPSIMAPGARIPMAIDAIVMRALSDVDDRFPTAAAMAGALRDALAQLEAPPAVTAPEPQPRQVDELAASSGSIPAPVLPVADDVGLPASVPAPPVSIDSQAPVAADEEQPEDRSLMMLASPVGEPRRSTARTPHVIGACIGVILCFAAIGTLWRMGAALDGPLVAEQAMNTAPSQETGSVTVPRPAPDRPPAPDLLPPTPPAPTYTPVTTPKIGNNAGDARVTRVRREIRRCKPLVPFSNSRVTVEADTDGHTQILFGGRTADGEFGRCVGKVAARTRVARDERLSFHL